MMAETQVLPGSLVVLRVAVLVADPARRAALAARVTDAGHVIASGDQADVAVSDEEADSRVMPVVVIGPAESGAAGLLPSGADARQLDAALRAAAAGLSVRPRRERSFAEIEESDSAVLLTTREMEVLAALSDGLSNKGAARRLDISQHTVKFHVESIFRKLGVGTRAEAVAKGLRRGIMHF